ncbi:MAG: hypothetical protein ACHRXM_23190 [Isosphaerales bacterium]
MWFKKTSKSIYDPADHISAIVMPHKGRTDDEVVDFFNCRGVSDITRLAPGFLSVNARRDVLKDAESVGRVEQKLPKQTR